MSKNDKIEQEIRFVFTCELCKKSIEVYQPRSAKPKKKCPFCGKHKLYQEYTTNVGIVYGYENAKTFGQISELNKKRLGKELVQKMFDDDPVVQARKSAKQNEKWALPKSVDLNDAKSVERYIEGDN